MTSAAIYARISIDRTGEGLGVDRQQEICRDLAADLDLDVTHVLVENDTSAYGKRPQFDRLLELVESGSVDAIVAYHGDRLARRPRDLERLLTLVESGSLPGGVHYKLAGSVDLSTPAGRAVARTIVAWSNAESETAKARQLAANLQHAKSGGIHGGRRPLGYNADRVTIHPIEGPLLQAAAARIIAGESLRSIAASWTADAPGKSTAVDGEHRGVSASSIRRTLLSTRIIGERRFENTDGVTLINPDAYEPILTREIWETMTAVLTSPSRRQSTSQTLVRWLSGVAVCETCERPLSGHSGGSQRKPIYVCRTSGCPHKVSMQNHVLEGIIEPMLLAVLADPRLAAKVGGIGQADALVDLDDELDVLAARLDAIEDQVIGGTVSAEQFGRVSAKVNDRVAVLTAERNAILSSTSMPSVVPPGLWEQMTANERRDIAAAVFVRIVVKGAGPSGKWGDPTERIVVEWRR